MSTLSLDIEPVRPERSHQPQRVPFQFRFESVTKTYVPGRALACSVILHEIVVFAVLSLSFASFTVTQSRSKDLDESVTDLAPSRDIAYLPNLGGGNEGNGRPSAGQGGDRRGASELPARSSKGLSYPGPQPIVSDPPRALNPSQTLLHPTVKNPPQLPKFIPLPNMVQMANAGPVQMPNLVEPLKVKRDDSVHIRALPTVEAPKLTVRAGDNNVSELVAKTDRPMPNLKVAPPPPVEISDLQMSGPDQKNIVALSPVPPPAQVPAKIPNGEARGRFAISPEPTVATPDPGAGSRGGVSAAGTIGIGTQTSAIASNAVSGDTGSASGTASHGTGEGGVAVYGIGRGGSYGGGNVSNGGRGSGFGSGVGAASGSGSGTGSGAGSGPGGGGFPGITIQGGQLGSTGTLGGRITPSLAPSVRGSYGMTIVSTPSSGGGLPDVGVFYNEKVYTVYLDMKSVGGERAPSWTLQYAVLKPERADPVHPAQIQVQGAITSPYPVHKDFPQLAPELQQQYARALIIASAVMDAKGMLSQVFVRQSPDVRLVQPVIDALNNWIFVPAEVNGQAVPLKILLGIRLSAPQR